MVRLHSRRSLFRASNRPAALSRHVRPAMRRQNPRVAHMAKVAFLGLGVMGFPMAGHLVKKGGHEVTVYNRTAGQGEGMGREIRRQDRADAEGRRRGPGLRDVLRRQRQRPARGHDRRRRRLRRHQKGRDLRRSHHGLRRSRPRARRRSHQARLQIRRRAGVRRPGRRRKRRADGDVRRQRGRLCRRRAGDRRLCADVQAAGTGGLRPTDQDGQPDLHRRPRRGPFGRHSFRQEVRPRRRRP